MEKYSMIPYRDPDAPVVFFGCYARQRQKVLRHKSLAVIVWIGGDALQLERDREAIEKFRSRKNIHHIAISSFLSRDLHRMKIPHIHLPIVPYRNDDLEAAPIGKAVYCYSSHDNPEFYGQGYINRLQARMKDTEFIIRYAKGAASESRQNLINIYRRCALGLRLTPHDGMSNTVVELGLMGRRCVWNGEAPGAIPWSGSLDELEGIIRTEISREGIIDTQLSERVRAFIDTGKEWLYSEFYNDTRKRISAQEGKPSVSVIINSWKNPPDQLRTAIRSYKNQKGVDTQVIVSTVIGDDAITIAREMGCDLVINKEPDIFNQYNATVKHITGNWVCYASGNDAALEDKCIREVSECMRTGKKICYSAFYLCDSELKIKSVRKFHPYNIELHKKGNFVSDCAMASAELIKKYTPLYTHFGNHAFWDLWLRIYRGEGDVFCYLEKPTWLYRINSNSQHIRRKKDPGWTAENLRMKNLMLNSHR